MANNPALKNAILAGIVGGNQQRSASELSAGNNDIFVSMANAIATAIDTAIPTIPAGISPGQAAVMQSICQGVFTHRNVQSIGNNFTDVINNIIGIYNRLDLSIVDQDAYVGTGGSGTPGAFVGFTQTFPAAATWIVNHNLGRHPYSWAVETLGGVEIDVAVQHTTINQSVVMFDKQTAGIVKFT